jgi:hypothetical protein
MKPQVPRCELDDGHPRGEGNAARLATLPGLYFTPWILGMAMAHSVAAVGLALAMLMQDVQWVWPLAAVAMVLLALRRPRFDALFERATRLARAPRAR